jgi:hypothetical protein
MMIKPNSSDNIHRDGHHRRRRVEKNVPLTVVGS